MKLHVVLIRVIGFFPRCVVNAASVLERQRLMWNQQASWKAKWWHKSALGSCDEWGWQLIVAIDVKLSRANTCQDEAPWTQRLLRQLPGRHIAISSVADTQDLLYKFFASATQIWSSRFLWLLSHYRSLDVDVIWKVAVNVLPCRDLIFFLITWGFFCLLRIVLFCGGQNLVVCWSLYIKLFNSDGDRGLEQQYLAPLYWDLVCS